MATVGWTALTVAAGSITITITMAATGLLGTADAAAASKAQDAKAGRIRSIRHALKTYGNPAALIRATNLVRQREKEQALFTICAAMISSRLESASDDELLRFRSALPASLGSFLEDAERRHWTADPGQLLILTAFAPSGEVLPPSQYKDQERPCSLMAPVSRTWPVVFIGDVPFDLTGAEAWAVPEPERGQCYGNTQVVRSFFEFVSWAQHRASPLSDPLVPPDALFDVVDTWLTRFSQSADSQQLLGVEGIARVTRLMQGQAIRMTEGILDEIAADSSSRVDDPATDTFDLCPMWSAYREAARSHRLRWNRETQKYEPGT